MSVFHKKNVLEVVMEMKGHCFLPVVSPTWLHSEPALSKKNEEQMQSKLPTAKFWWHHVTKNTLPQGLFSDSSGIKQGKASGDGSQGGLMLGATRRHKIQAS